MRNPDEEERMEFLYPLFMEKAFCKCLSSLDADDLSRKDPSYRTKLLFSKIEKLKNNNNDLSFWKKYETMCDKMTQSQQLDKNYYLKYEYGDFRRLGCGHEKHRCRKHAGY